LCLFYDLVDYGNGDDEEENNNSFAPQEYNTELYNTNFPVRKPL